MEFNSISSLFKAVDEGTVKKTDCVSFNAQNKTFYSQGRAVRIVHDIGCFFAKGILKFITIKKLTDYVTRHFDSAAVFCHNTDIAEFKTLKGKVTGAIIKKILNDDNKEKLLTEYTDTISVPPKKENFLPENVSAKVALSEKSKLETSIKTSDINTLLIVACLDGNEQEVKSLLEKNPEINSQNNDGNTALSIACSRGDKKIVELLLKYGANINSRSSNGDTALSLACLNGYEEIVKLLLKHDPEINSQNNAKFTALSLACLNHHAGVVKLLLAKNPDINSRDFYGDTALGIACSSGNEKIVELLLAKNPDISSKNNNGQTVIDYAKENNLTEIKQLLQQYQNKIYELPEILENEIVSDKISETILTENLKSETNLKTDTNNISFSNDNTTELNSKLLDMLEDTTKTANDIKEFLDGCSNIPKKELFKQINDMPYSHIVAVLARTNNDSDSKTIEEVNNIIKLLIDSGAPVSGIDKHGQGLISRAINNGYSDEVISYLIESVNVSILNQQSNEKITPLIMAIQKDNIVLVKKLFENSADINYQNNYGNTALSIACLNGHKEIIKLLLEHDPEISSQNKSRNTALSIACLRGDKEIVKSLLEKNAEINSQNLDGNTALSIACLRGDEEIVKLLLEKNPEINSKNFDGDTALIIACKYGHAKVAELLLEKNPEINSQNNKGKTAIDYAKEKKLTVSEQLLQDKKNI